jgi:hypothetical protein
MENNVLNNTLDHRFLTGGQGSMDLQGVRGEGLVQEGSIYGMQRANVNPRKSGPACKSNTTFSGPKLSKITNYFKGQTKFALMGNVQKINKK